MAGATIEAPITATEAASLLKVHQLEPKLIDDLIDCDAIGVNGVALEVRHEALADYLRAQKFASAPEAELISNLRTMVLSKDSLFPTLLMSQLRSRHSQSIFWERLSETDLGMYLDALRYRFDISEELGHLGQETLSRGYLEDILDGIELPLEAFCPMMRKTVIHYLTLQQDAKLGVTGIVHGPPVYEVAYGFRGYLDSNRIVVSRPERQSDIHTTSWLHLGRSGYRLDSGRLLGATRLRDTLLKLIDNQELEGGTAWITERLVSRIWYLQRSQQLDISEMASLDDLDRSLQPHAGKWVERGDGRPDWFSIDSMLRDITALRMEGKDHLDLWWNGCGWLPKAASQAQGVIVLAEFYRRQQIVFAEVVERTFPDLAKHMASYTSLPARWEITLIGGPEIFPDQRIHANWKPVASWNDAGADVIFGANMPPWRGDKDLREALNKLGRPNNRFRIGSMGIMPSFEGDWWDGRSKGATAVVREVCSLLSEEIKFLFSSLPSRDAFNRS